MGGDPICLEPVEKFRERDSARIDRPTLLHLRDQSGTFDLCLPLRSLEGMPAALTLTSLWIARVEDDGPMTGASLADMAFHGLPAQIDRLRCQPLPKSLMISASASHSSPNAAAGTAGMPGRG